MTAALSFERPSGLLAGFHATKVPECPAIQHCGEQWMPWNFKVPRNSHPAWEYYFMVEGNSEWRAGSGKYLVQPNHLLIIPPGIPHHLVRVYPDALHALYLAVREPEVTFQHVETRRVFYPGHQVRLLPRAERVHDAFRFVIREVSTASHYRAQALSLALELLLLDIVRLLENSKVQSLIRLHPGILRAKSALERSPGAEWTTRKLASLAALSEARFITLFNEQTGVTPHCYQTSLRLDSAKRMLCHSHASITEIALELGFSTSQHFANTFRKRVGCTPSRFRRDQIRESASELF